jgi:hypothetical protein
VNPQLLSGRSPLPAFNLTSDSPGVPALTVVLLPAKCLWQSSAYYSDVPLVGGCKKGSAMEKRTESTEKPVSAVSVFSTVAK